MPRRLFGVGGGGRQIRAGAGLRCAGPGNAAGGRGSGTRACGGLDGRIRLVTAAMRDRPAMAAQRTTPTLEIDRGLA